MNSSDVLIVLMISNTTKSANTLLTTSKQADPLVKKLVFDLASFV